jgi:hypothetical protein
MTAIIKLPGVLTSVPPGMEEAILLEPSGFVSRGLQALFLFEEASGTALVDAKGGADGVIDNIGSSNNAFSRLSGGGIQLSGAQLGSFPAFEGSDAWTLIAAVRVVNHTGTAGTEKVAGIIGNRSFGTVAAQRGAYLYQRGATNLSADHTNARYEHRPTNGAGGQGTQEILLPSGINTFNLPRLAIISYNGTDTIESRIVDGSGAVVSSDTLTTNDTALWSVSSTVASVQQWCIGGINGNFAGGVIQYECAARYSRFLSDFSPAEIALIAQATAAIGADRGRAW